jgi:hypothetical protein
LQLVEFKDATELKGDDWVEVRRISGMADAEIKREGEGSSGVNASNVTRDARIRH